MPRERCLQRRRRCRGRDTLSDHYDIKSFKRLLSTAHRFSDLPFDSIANDGFR
jgi:hypothetical protein